MFGWVLIHYVEICMHTLTDCYAFLVVAMVEFMQFCSILLINNSDRGSHIKIEDKTQTTCIMSCWFRFRYLTLWRESANLLFFFIMSAEEKRKLTQSLDSVVLNFHI